MFDRLGKAIHAIVTAIYRIVAAILAAIGVTTIVRGVFNREPRQPAPWPVECQRASPPPRSAEGEQLPPEEIHYADGRIEHPRVRREPRDVRFAWVLAVVIGAICIAVVHYYVMWKFFWGEQVIQETAKKSPYGVVPNAGLHLPPEPRLEQLDRLQGIESSDIRQREAARLKVLQSLGPTGHKEFVHVPIGDAMDWIAGRLPVRKEGAGAGSKDAGLIDSGEPNSGRMYSRSSP